MILPPLIELLLCAVLLAGLAAGYLVWQPRGDWGLVRHAPWPRLPHHEVWVTGKAPFPVRAAALMGVLICPIYVHAALIGGYVALAIFFGLSNGQIAPNVGSIFVLNLWAPLGLLAMGLAGTVDPVMASRAFLRRDPNASALARRIATVHTGLGGILTGLGALSVALSAHSWFLLLYIVTLCIGPILAAHGVLLRYAASALDAYDAAQARRPK